jgi:RNA recognition motif. (a.k.a. RRM, RBD, or RNP domain)
VAPAREFPPCLPLALRRLRAAPPKTATSEISATGRRLNPARFISICGYSEVTKLYVGNLPFNATEDSVRALFAPHGTVEKLSLITDRDTGRPRGFGFVEMSNADASRAMQALNGQDFGGRQLKINEAQDRAGGGGGGGPRRY